mmetsp:Transcript_3459/g.10834  ORF Transcript_3459/g.10834 Transcript_3459/m.10834 type:complete len:262 (-) Transcript_3459:1588-2373(-)
MLSLTAAARHSVACLRPRCPRHAHCRRTTVCLRRLARKRAAVRRHQRCTLAAQARSRRKRRRSFRTRSQTCRTLTARSRRLRRRLAPRARSALCRRRAARARRSTTARRRASRPRPNACSLTAARMATRKRCRATCRCQWAWRRMAALRQQLVRAPLSTSMASLFRKTRVAPMAHAPPGRSKAPARAPKRTCAATPNLPRAIWASSSRRHSAGAMQRKSRTPLRWLRRMGKPARLTSMACSTPWYWSCCTTDRRSNLPGTL